MNKIILLLTILSFTHVYSQSFSTQNMISQQQRMHREARQAINGSSMSIRDIYESRIKKLDSKINSLYKKLDEKEKELTELENIVGELETTKKVGETTKRIDKIKDKIESKNAQITKYKNAITELDTNTKTEQKKTKKLYLNSYEFLKPFPTSQN